MESTPAATAKHALVLHKNRDLGTSDASRVEVTPSILCLKFVSHSSYIYQGGMTHLRKCDQLGWGNEFDMLSHAIV